MVVQAWASNPVENEMSPRSYRRGFAHTTRCSDSTVQIVQRHDPTCSGIGSNTGQVLHTACLDKLSDLVSS